MSMLSSGYIIPASLSLQFAAQPFIVAYLSAQEVSSLSLAFTTELLKCVYCLTVLQVARPRWAESWSLRHSLLGAGLPSATYAVQNVCMQVAYKKMDALVCNLVNQTKLFSTALFCYLLFRQSRTSEQLLALGLICLGSTLGCAEGSELTWGDGDSVGLVCLLTASLLSGFGSAVSERALRDRDAHLFSLELSVYSQFFLLSGVAYTRIFNPSTGGGFFEAWTPFTLVPAMTQALGGVLVGRVTKDHGSLMKCFAVIFGILLTALFRAILSRRDISLQLILAIGCVVAGIALHQRGPARPGMNDREPQSPTTIANRWTSVSSRKKE